MEFLRTFLRRHFVGKPVLKSRNAGCFLSLDNRSHCTAKKLLGICLQLFLARKERVLCTQWQGTKCMIDDSMMGLISSNDQNDITHCRALLEKRWRQKIVKDCNEFENNLKSYSEENFSEKFKNCFRKKFINLILHSKL